jgi:hypothetical protein
MKLETFALGLAILVALACAISYGFDSVDCGNKGGAMIQNAWGGYSCVKVIP